MIVHFEGFDAFNRDYIKRQTTPIAETIYNAQADSLITVWDGTYIFTQKSDNYDF